MLDILSKLNLNSSIKTCIKYTVSRVTRKKSPDHSLNLEKHSML
jgi:hypothetical protein